MSKAGNNERKPQSVDVYAGQRIRMRRAMLGVSQEQLADLSGITFQQVQKYERGTNRMSVSRLYEFAKFLGVPFGFFVEGFETPKMRRPQALAENEQQPFDFNDRLSSKETIELVKIYYSIEDDKKRRELFRLIRSMAQSLQ